MHYLCNVIVMCRCFFLGAIYRVADGANDAWFTQQNIEQRVVAAFKQELVRRLCVSDVYFFKIIVF